MLEYDILNEGGALFIRSTDNTKEYSVSPNSTVENRLDYGIQWVDIINGDDVIFSQPADRIISVGGDPAPLDIEDLITAIGVQIAGISGGGLQPQINAINGQINGIYSQIDGINGEILLREYLTISVVKNLEDYGPSYPDLNTLPDGRYMVGIQSSHYYGYPLSDYLNSWFDLQGGIITFVSPFRDNQRIHNIELGKVFFYENQLTATPIIDAGATFSDINGNITGSQIAANTVENSNLAQAPANTYKGNPTGSSAYEQDVSTNSAFNQSFETSISNIKMDGAVSIGSLSTIARADHIHPSDTTKAGLSSNNTFTGTNTFSNDVSMGLSQSATSFTDVVVDSVTNTLRKKPSLSILGDVLSIESIPPALTGGGARYLVASTGTSGAFIGNENKIATDNGASFGFYTPVTGDITNLPDGTTYRFNGTSWVIYVVNVSGGNIVQTIASTTTLTTWQRTVLIDATTASIVVTLPSVSSSNTGQNIELKRVDNSTNTVRIIPSSGQTSDGQIPTGGIYLFSQYDAIVVRSNGVSASYIVSDNRGSVGQSRGYLQVSRPTAQTTGIAVGNPILFNTIVQSNGSSIVLNTTTGIFTLKAGKTYRLSGTAGDLSGGSRLEYQWYDITNSASLGGSVVAFAPNDSYASAPIYGPATAVVMPNTDINVRLNIVGGATGSLPTAIGAQILSNLYPTAYIEEISTPANVINTVDYLQVRRVSTDQTGFTAGSDLIFNAVAAGNIPFNTTTGVATLQAGKTYNISVSLSTMNFSATGYVQYAIVDASNTQLSAIGELLPVTQTVGNSDGILEFIFTPTVNTNIKVRGIGASGSCDIRSALYSGMVIRQIGSSAATTVIGATSTTQGVQGVVPAPQAGQQRTLLMGNATWGYPSGMPINTVTYSASDLSGLASSVGTASFTNLFTAVNYQPKSSNSTIIVTYDAKYSISGFGLDAFESRILVNGTTPTGSGFKRQEFNNGGIGGGTRSSTLTPISCKYTNAGLTSISIAVQFRQNTSDDTISIDTSNMLLTITEIQN